jgi:hypothetical protein
VLTEARAYAYARFGPGSAFAAASSEVTTRALGLCAPPGQGQGQVSPKAEPPAVFPGRRRDGRRLLLLSAGRFP